MSKFFREISSLYGIARPSVVCCLSSITFVCPTQAIEIVGDVLRHLLPTPPTDIQIKFYVDRLRGTPVRQGS